MKKVLAYGGMILLFVLLQCSFFTHLSLADVVPNLLIILTASIAIINGSLEGCLVGFFSGLLLDLMFGPYIGMYAFGYLLCGYLTGYYISCINDRCGRFVLRMLYVHFRLYDPRQIECAVLSEENHFTGGGIYCHYCDFPLQNHINYY